MVIDYSRSIVQAIVNLKSRLQSMYSPNYSLLIGHTIVSTYMDYRLIIVFKPFSIYSPGYSQSIVQSTANLKSRIKSIYCPDYSQFIIQTIVNLKFSQSTVQTIVII